MRLRKDKKINYKVIASSLIAITLVGITGISIGRYSGNIPIKMDAVMNAAGSMGNNVNEGFVFIKNEFINLINYRENATKVNATLDKNQELEQEVIDLKNELQKVSSLERLKSGLNYIDEEYKAKSISASVVSKNNGNWYETIVVGAGKNHGVKENSIAINANGVVGLVYEVMDDYSKIISILDSKSSVSFKLVKNGEYQGVLTDSINLTNKEKYRDDGYLYGYVFDTSYEVLPGDVVTTSGMGLYPEGIPIGVIDKVTEDKNNSMKYVIVKPYVNFKYIDDVIIVEPRDMK